jgi:thiosulfate dehydrogenase [quinone] large subunit
MTPYKSLRTIPIPPWVLLPMRLFLGVTFVYAGVQKFTDPQFFNPSAAGYIGKQIANFATSSPLHSILLMIEPHATLFGLLTAYGEIAIGIGMLFGFLFRPAAFFGMLLNLLFFLSATWRVYPYFYGSDIVFIFCWLTMLLNGPLNTGLPTLDAWFTINTLYRLSVPRQKQLKPFFALVLGTTRTATETTATVAPQPSKQIPHRGQPQRRRYSVVEQARESRRNFLMGALTGGASVFSLLAIGYGLRRLFGGMDDTSSYTPARISDSSGLTSSSSSNDGSGSSSTATTGTGQSGSTIAQVSAVPTNSATNFTIPSNGDPGVLVHLNNGQFVAYDALCTHAGCQVDYDPQSQLLLCPCHGAAFDPAKNGAVVNPPAQTPLPAVSIHVDSATGAITLA